MGKRVLVVVAHSDDETIGMGGTIRRHVLSGDEVSVVSMTDGVGARNSSSEKDIESRRSSAAEAAKLLGFSWAGQYAFDDNSMDKYPLI